MIYDEAGGDFAVCDPKIFQKTYINDAGQYNAMQGVNPGQRIHATKQAVGGFEVMSEGTVVKTLEGPRTVGKGEVVCYDVDGNPYVSPLKNVLKRNTITNPEQIPEFYQVDPLATLKSPEAQEAMAQWLLEKNPRTIFNGYGNYTYRYPREFEINGHKYHVRCDYDTFDKQPMYLYGLENENGIDLFFREGEIVPEYYLPGPGRNGIEYSFLPSEEYDIIRGIEHSFHVK